MVVTAARLVMSTRRIPAFFMRSMVYTENADLVGMVSYFYKPKWYLGKRRGIKGHEDFIDAISIVRETNPQVIGVIIGGHGLAPNPIKSAPICRKGVP